MSLINPLIVGKLRKGAKLLSLGCGNCHLERTLLTFSIPPEQMTITDLELTDLARKTPFRKFQFDFTKPKDWPDFKTHFNYIFFPESYGMINTSAQEITELEKLAKSTKEILSPELVPKIIASDTAMDYHTLQKILQLPNCSYEDRIGRTLESAIKILALNGEIRICHTHVPDLILAIVLTKLKRVYNSSKFLTWHKEGATLVIKNEEHGVVM